MDKIEDRFTAWIFYSLGMESFSQKGHFWKMLALLGLGCTIHALKCWGLFLKLVSEHPRSHNRLINRLWSCQYHANLLRTRHSIHDINLIVTLTYISMHQKCRTVSMLHAQKVRSVVHLKLWSQHHYHPSFSIKSWPRTCIFVWSISEVLRGSLWFDKLGLYQ